MSDGNEVKRWGLWRRFKEESLMVVHGEYDMSQLGPCDTAIEVMPVTDHDRIVANLKSASEIGLIHSQVNMELRETIAELRAEVERLTGEVVRRNQYKLNQEMLDVAHKVYEDRIARQARVIEKLMNFLRKVDAEFGCGKHPHEEWTSNLCKQTIAELAAIERAEGEKE